MAMLRVGPGYEVVIPKSARESIGLKVGDLMEASVQQDAIVLRAKTKSKKRLEIQRRLAAAEADVQAGRVLGPFQSATAALCAVRRRADARHPD